MKNKNNPALSENKQPVQFDERSWNKMIYPIWLILVWHYRKTQHPNDMGPYQMTISFGSYHMDHIIWTIAGKKHMSNVFLILVVNRTTPNKTRPNKIFDPSLKMGWKELFSMSNDWSTILVWSHFFFTLLFFFSSPGSIILK